MPRSRVYPGPGHTRDLRPDLEIGDVRPLISCSWPWKALGSVRALSQLDRHRLPAPYSRGRPVQREPAVDPSIRTTVDIKACVRAVTIDPPGPKS